MSIVLIHTSNSLSPKQKCLIYLNKTLFNIKISILKCSTTDSNKRQNSYLYLQKNIFNNMVKLASKICTLLQYIQDKTFSLYSLNVGNKENIYIYIKTDTG